MTITDHSTDTTLAKRIIVERHSLGQDVVKDAAACSGGYFFKIGLDIILGNNQLSWGQPENNFSVDANFSQLISSNDFVDGKKDLSFAPLVGMPTGKKIDAQNDVLTGRTNGTSVGR